jgi:ribonuclease P protein component
MRKSAEIERVKREGRRFQSSLFNLMSCPSPEPHPRVGIIVGSRFGTAVRRNRAKRLFRELARQFRSQLVSNRAVLVFPRRGALEVKFAELTGAWSQALEHEGLLKAHDPNLS